jgi:DNA polymerase-3 subunit delta
MQNAEFSAALKRKAPVIMLAGEPYIVHRALQALKAQVLEPALRDLNLTEFVGKAATPAAVCKIARTAPVFAARRLVIAEDPPEIAGFADYGAAPCKTTCLVFVVDKPDGRTKFVSALKKAGGVITFPALKEHELAPWLQAECKRERITIDSRAAALIVDTVGTDMACLLDAAHKAALFAPERGTITTAHVQAVCADVRKDSIFDFIDGIAGRELRKALPILENLFANREEPIVLCKIIEGHIRKLWACRGLIDEGYQAPALIAEKMKVHPYLAGKLYAQALPLTMQRIGQMHTAVFQCDRALKRSKLPPRVLLENLVTGLCR